MEDTMEIKEPKVRRELGHYCFDCKNRLDRESSIPRTKDHKFCALGYTQNPVGKEQTFRSIKNGAQVCDHNPHRHEIRESLS